MALRILALLFLSTVCFTASVFATSDDDDDKSAVKAWLKERNLGDYADKFIENGFHSLDMVKSMESEDWSDTVAEIIPQKLKQKLFLREVQKYKDSFLTTCPSKDPSSNLTVLGLIKSVFIPDDQVEQRRTVVWYSTVVEFKDENTPNVLTTKRYSHFRLLKDQLGLKKLDAFFPPKNWLPDAVWVKTYGLAYAVRDRLKGLSVWLNNTLQHVLEIGDESKAGALYSFLTDSGMDEVNAASSNEGDAKQKALQEQKVAQDQLDKKPREWYEKKGGSCSIKVKSAFISEWVKSPEFEAMNDKDCPSFGDSFGWWGKVSCPGQLADISESIKNAKIPCKEGKGGLGGIPPVICAEYVLKVAKDEEVDPIYGLLHKLSETNYSTDKLSLLLSPICRTMKVTHPDPKNPERDKVSHFTVVPNFRMKDVEGMPFDYHTKFDMKGNWGWQNRMAKAGEDTMKDGNFKKEFSDGIDFVGQAPDGKDVIDLVVDASKILADLGHLDYSIFADIVNVTNFEEDIRKIKEANPKVPLVWGTNKKGVKFAMTFAIIDLFMRDDKRSQKDIWGTLVTVPQSGTCTAFDADPLHSKSYSVRFEKMVGYSDPGPGKHAVDPPNPFIQGYKCGACYHRGMKYWVSKVQSKPVQFTYFRSVQQQQTRDNASCEWKPVS